MPIKEWRRFHSDRSRSVVERHESGLFVAVDLIPVDGRLHISMLRQHHSFDEACEEADAATRRRLHTCDGGCSVCEET